MTIELPLIPLGTGATFSITSLSITLTATGFRVEVLIVFEQFEVGFRTQTNGILLEGSLSSLETTLGEVMQVRVDGQISSKIPYLGICGVGLSSRNVHEHKMVELVLEDVGLLQVSQPLEELRVVQHLEALRFRIDPDASGWDCRSGTLVNPPRQGREERLIAQEAMDMHIEIKLCHSFLPVH